ncbi:DUF4376 domain-containing protein [Variovorax sp.]|uniref:DUF4376 domain-containing protein n=1 Tax=Variovorax sp. TaxID=1871043 RepID=UPI003BAB9672
MIKISFYVPITGEVRLTTDVPDLETAQRAAAEVGLPFAEHPVGLAEVYRDTVEDAWRLVPTRPSAAHVFDWRLHAWHDPRTLDDHRQALLAAVAARRWQCESAGLTLPDGLRVATGREDRANLRYLIADAAEAGLDSVDFKSAGGWARLTLKQLQAAAAAIQQHVQACFSAERAHHDAIAALTSSEDIDNYDVEAGWPRVDQLLPST